MGFLLKHIWFGCVAFVVLLLEALSDQVLAQGTNGSVPFVSVVNVFPDTLTRNTNTYVTAKLNISNCSGLVDPDVPPVSPILQLKHDGFVAEYVGQLSKDCSAVNFWVNTTGVSQGVHQFAISLWEDPLPSDTVQGLTVQDPPALAIAAAPWLQQRANLDMVVHVPVSISVPSSEAVSVDLSATEAASIEVLPNSTLIWAPGEAGQKTFTARLLTIPASGTVHLHLTQPVNAVLPPASASAEVAVGDLPVPVFSFQANQAVYRGERLQIQLQVDGVQSANTSHLQYNTFVVPSSYASGSPSFRMEQGLTTSGLLRIDTLSGAPLPALNLSLNWSSVPFEAEYQVGVQLRPTRNAGVKEQLDDVGLFVFGVKEGTCPPGTSLLSDSAELPSFSKDAPLQDLRLEVCCDANSSSPYNISLFPAFTPRTTSSYKAMIPWGKPSLALAFTSMREGDLVSVTLNCANTTTTYPITKTTHTTLVPVTNDPCRVTLRVATPYPNATANATAAALAVARYGLAAGAPPPPAPGYKTLATYQVDLSPLVNPELLRLKAVSLVNATTVTVLCGTPAVEETNTTAIATTMEELSKVVPRQVLRTNYTLPTCLPEACMFADVASMGESVQLVPEAAHPNSPGVEFVNGTFSLGGLALLGNRSYIKVPITLTSNDNVSSETYTLVLLTAPPPSPPPSSAPALEAALHLTCASDSPIASGTAISSEATTITASTASQTHALQHYVFDPRSAAYPPHPALNPNCSICPNGSYSSRPNAAVCQLCPPGHYATLSPWPRPLPTSCTACRPGTYTYTWGSASCTPCFPGTYAPNLSSLYCSICPDSWTTNSQAAARCPIRLTNPRALYNTTYADILSFGVLVNGTTLDALVNQTGINASTVTILSLLIRTDLASFLNISLDAVVVTGSHYVSRRALLLNVSATVPAPAPGADEQGAAVDTQQLSADDLVQRLNGDPDGIFMRTVQMTGADVSVLDFKRKRTRLRRHRHHLLLHAILWPLLLGMLALCGGSFCWCRRCRSRSPRPSRALSDSSHFFKWVKSSPSSSLGSASSELELQELTVASISPPPRQRAKQQFITDMGQYDRYQELHDTGSRFSSL